MNTWAVAKAGAYDEVKTKYFELAIEKNEGIYTKAVAYYIDDIDENGKETRSLVIKKIVEMQSYENMNMRRKFIGDQNQPKKEFVIDQKQKSRP